MRRKARRAAGHDVLLVEPDDRPNYEEFEAIVRQYDGEMLPVFLHCPQEEALRRVGNLDRIERGKLTSAEGLISYLDGHNFTSVPQRIASNLIRARCRPALSREIVGRLGFPSQ